MSQQARTFNQNNQNGGYRQQAANQQQSQGQRQWQSQNTNNYQQGNQRGPQQQNNSADDSAGKFMNIKSHGNKCAIEVAPDNTMKDWSTIRIEGAPKKGDGTKAYSWSEKVSIQITKTELPMVIAVLLGYLPCCEFKNHGGDANKWFYIENQKKNFFFKVGQAGEPKKMMVCPVPTVEAHLMGLLALSQHTKNFDGLTTDAALEAIKVMSGHMLKSGQVNLPNTQNRRG